MAATYKVVSVDDGFEFGVTGHVEKLPDGYHPLGYFIVERVVFGENDQFFCWVQPDLDEAGHYTGMWTPFSLDDCSTFGLRVDF